MTLRMMMTRTVALTTTVLCILLVGCSRGGDPNISSLVPAGVESAAFLNQDLMKELAADSLEAAMYERAKAEAAAIFDVKEIRTPVVVVSVKSLSPVRDFFIGNNYNVVKGSVEAYVDHSGSEYLLIDSEHDCYYRSSSLSDSERDAFLALPSAAAAEPFSRTAISENLDYTKSFAAMSVLPVKTKKSLVEAGVPSALVDRMDGALVANAQIEGPALDGVIFPVSKDGKKVTIADILPYNIDPQAKVASRVTDCMDSEINAVVALALKGINWEAWASDVNNSLGSNFGKRATISMLRSFLEKIDGTVSLGAGLDVAEQADLTSLAFDPSGLIVTLAAETKAGGANELLTDIRRVAQFLQIPTVDNGDGFSAQVPGYDVTLWAQARADDLLVISTRPVIANAGRSDALSVLDGGNYIAFLAASVPAGSPLQQLAPTAEAQDVSFGLGLDVASSSLVVKCRCGKDGNFIDNIKKLIDR